MGKRGIQPRYTQAEIVAAAIELIDRDPGTELTIRALAQHLGLGTMSLYGYFPNKDELLEAIAASLFESLDGADHRDAPWQDRLREQALTIHDVVVRHPNVGRILRAHATPHPTLFRVREQMVSVLTEAGFELPAALEAMGIIASYAQGFASVQAATLDSEPLKDRIRQLPADEFPLLNAGIEHYPNHISDASFRHGLDLLISGFSAELGDGRRPTPPSTTGRRKAT